ncbi:beta-mannosidase [Limibacterium fermenti]|jgi:beta-mannosidase|uniref:beta-mannosidase n=1 Tax=Limibacterium fermenti TaxID=3229863 RepID=UPI000E9B330E|nr:beta-mannosidase [Porphyromonadaceae bacterium]
MKKVMMMILGALFCFSMEAQKASEVYLPLNDGWQFTQTGKNDWRNAEVPGSVQRDLIRYKVLPDPYYGTNEKKVQWPEKEDWDFKKTFSVTAEQLKYDDAVIFFEGLDTHADVFLNGSRIFQSANMFVGHKVSVKNVLREGDNKLYIRFHSPVTYMEPAYLTNGYNYPAGNDHSDVKMSVFSRKAPYQFGWDWGMRLVQMGIWKPVSLTFYNQARIEDYFVKQTSVGKEKAEIEHRVEVYSVTEGPATLSVSASFDNKPVETVQKDVVLQKGKNIVSLPMTVKNPHLWMPAGWGEQYLYDFSVTLSIRDQAIAQTTERTGFRSVRLVQEKDEHGRSFYFEVNGIPLFAKGANYIPGEILRTQQDSAYYERLFDHVTSANMNMLRVWGGGTYEDNYFYRLADEKGILIWQDFIFGCVPYPSDDAFLANVAEEAVYNIKRLRNHASLAFWCGNNEIYEGINYWGWDKEYPSEVLDEWRRGYDKTFRELIPSLVTEYDGTRSYIHGSPYDSNWGRPEKFSASDVHDWGLWHGRMPFEAMADRLPRFASEFGFQSFPEMKTIRTFAEEKDFDINSDVMKTHQKSGIGNQAIKEYMEMYYHTPKNFEDFIYVGLIMQGNGMEEAVEANRRGRPYCMGALYWQINDDWPVVSWSSIDYYQNWKAQHYKMRNVFAPLALGVEHKNNVLTYFTMSDNLQDIDDLQLNVQVLDFSGKRLKSFTEKISAKANASTRVKAFNTSELVTEEEKHRVVIHAWLSDKKGAVISQRNYYFYWPNKLELPETAVHHTVKYADGKYTVTLSGKKLAKDVFVEIPVLGASFSDNFFDLLPGEKKTIVITSPELKASAKTPITVKHLRETY